MYKEVPLGGWEALKNALEVYIEITEKNAQGYYVNFPDLFWETCAVVANNVKLEQEKIGEPNVE